MLHSTSNMTFGVLSLTCSPSEGVNNLLLLLADGDLTLSTTISSVNNFATLAMIPVWTILFETRLFSVAGNTVIPFREIFFVFAASLALLLSGYVLQRRYSDLYDVCWMYLPIFTVCTIVFSVIASLFVNGFIFRYITVRIFLLSALLAAAGYGVGAASAFAVGLPQSRILTIAVETGGRTTVITNLLLVSSMAQPEADLAKTAPVLCSLLSVVPAFVAILVRRFMLRLRERKYAQTECTFIDSRDDVSEEEVVAAKETCM
ncbi:hypothetical protein LSAT2_018652 [Lamellibrachia satsuma]|nr:hypothetical protein LSAT2_018652 [Lamellibrachia satsuma]